MWRWQQSGRNRLWTHIIAGCTLLHGIMLCMLFLVYRGSVDNYLIYTASALTTQHVILLPLHKVVGSKQMAATPPISTPVFSALDTQSDVVERQAPAERATKTTTLVSTPKSKSMKKKSPKKSKKTVRNKKKKNKKEIKNKKTKETPKLEKKAAEPKPVEKKEDVKPVVEQPMVESQVAMSVPADAQSAIYVGQLEYEALQLQEAVQGELQNHWKPPIGHAGLTCIVRVILDWQGVIVDSVVEQSSGVLMFDMSAEQAINAMVFPKMAWGKQMTITFN
ncbi:MAG: TonB C-terminal domain-containing protein [Candidatus Babeliales bacterium]